MCDSSAIRIHIGPSMSPTLRPGDQIVVVPYDGWKARRGDVIVFRGPGGQQIAHRAVRVESQGIRTRGDNNRDMDPWTLSPEDILGQVVYVQRAKRRRKVFGGLAGRVFGAIVRGAHLLDASISRLLRPTYHRLARRRFATRFMSRHLQTRVVSFIRPEGLELHLLVGRLVIGRRLPGEAQWCIRRPFRLLVDETRLSE